MQRAIYDLCGTPEVSVEQMGEQVSDALRKMEGVISVGFNADDNVVLVEFCEPATKERLTGCIESVGSGISYEQ